MRKVLRFVKVCVACSWLGVALGLAAPLSVLYCLIAASVLVIVIQLIECLLAAIHRHRSRMIPNSYYGPARHPQPQPKPDYISPAVVNRGIAEEYRATLLSFTSDAVATGVCECCHSRHSLLTRYPFDPQLHFNNCPIPQMRAEVAPIQYCPDEVSHEV